MTKARTLGNFVSTGNPLSDGSIAASEVTGLSTVATTGSYNDLSDKPTITTTATNIAGGSNGTIPYQSAAGTTQMLAVGTSGQLLKSNGAAAPSWVTFSSTPTIVRSVRTSNTILGTADASTLIAITSGTFTQTFTAAATLGSGWFCYIQNSGTGDITLDPDGSETIDGLTSFIMYPGEVRLVQCDGTGFNSIVIDGFYATFTASGTFVKPPGYSQFGGLAWGGGGGGNRSSGSGGAGGGGGACAPFTAPSSVFSSSVTVTIGAGGTGATSDNTAGGNGGNTVFGIVTAYGGGGGASNANGGAGGGVLSRADTYEPGLPFDNSSVRANSGFGGAGGKWSSAYGGAGGAGYNGGSTGGASYYGGAGGGNGQYAGGTSVFGGNGGSGTNSSPQAGSAPAGGGQGSETNAGGAGGRGELRVWGIV